MDTNILLALALTIIIVVGVNGFLILATRKKGGAKSFGMLGNSFKIAANPFQDENETLAELDRLTKSLQNEDDQPEA